MRHLVLAYCLNCARREFSRFPGHGFPFVPLRRGFRKRGGATTAGWSPYAEDVGVFVCDLLNLGIEVATLATPSLAVQEACDISSSNGCS